LANETPSGTAAMVLENGKPDIRNSGKYHAFEAEALY
jgi:hypothetical protein